MTTLIKKDVSDEKTKCTYSSEWFSYWYHGWCMNHKNSNILNSLKIRRICVGFLFKTNKLDIFVIIWWHGLYPLSLVYLSPIWCRGINTITWTSCILKEIAIWSPTNYVLQSPVPPKWVFPWHHPMVLYRWCRGNNHFTGTGDSK